MARLLITSYVLLHLLSKGTVSAFECRALVNYDCTSDKSLNTSRKILKKAILVQDDEQCMKECFYEPACVSYNIGQTNAAIAVPCELSAADHVREPDKLVTRPGYNYCSFMNPCESNPCPNDTSCQPDFNSKHTFSCIRGCGNYPHPLGMEDGTLPDENITASSEKDRFRLASFARLHNQKTGSGIGAWAPAVSSTGEYLQVDLGRVMWVTHVATQGRPPPDYPKYVKQYRVKYSLVGSGWKDFMQGSSFKIFNGNTDQDSVVTNAFVPVLRARYVRIVVLAWYDFINLRAELYGCMI